MSYGLRFLALGRPIEAERFLLSVTSIRPENVDAYRGLAGIYYDRGAMSHALAHLEKWAALDASDGRPHRYMGLIYKDQGDNTAAADHYREVHEVKLQSTSRVAAAMGTPAPRCHCVHHQAVEVLGDGLVVTAWADGVVEAIEATDANRWLVGVQWHPEDTAADDPEQQRLFAAFVASCR